MPGSKRNGSCPSPANRDFSFLEADLARARLIQDLRMDFGVNDEGMGCAA
jgi:chaperone modulatory protein CbpM